MKRVTTGLLVLMASAMAAAQEKPLALGVHLGTYHDTGGYEGFNPGVYLLYSGWTAGVFHNSVRKTSYYAGYSWERKIPALLWLDSLALTAGVVSGYPYTLEGTGVFPMLVPSATVGLGHGARVRAALIPHIAPYTLGSAVHFSVEKSF